MIRRVVTPIACLRAGKIRVIRWESSEKLHKIRISGVISAEADIRPFYFSAGFHIMNWEHDMSCKTKE